MSEGGLPAAQALALLGVGLGAGVLSGIFGIGGGIVMVPALVLLLGRPATEATGLSLMALLLPVGLLGVWQYFRDGRLSSADIPLAGLLAGGLALGAWAGARLSFGLDAALLKRLFAVLLLFVAARLWFSARG